MEATATSGHPARTAPTPATPTPTPTSTTRLVPEPEPEPETPALAPPHGHADETTPPPARKKLIRTAFLADPPPAPPQPPQPPEPEPDPEPFKKVKLVRQAGTLQTEPSDDRPPLDKITIKINRHDDSEPVDSAPVNNCKDDDDSNGALKMTIKFNKNHDQITENSTDAAHIVKVSKMLQPSPEPPSVPKLTIKIPPEYDHKLEQRCSPVPRVIIKPIMKPDSPTVPKLNIKPYPLADKTDGVHSPKSKLKALLGDNANYKYSNEDACVSQCSPSRMSKSKPTLEDKPNVIVKHNSKVSYDRYSEESDEQPSEFNPSEESSDDVHESVPKLTIKPIPIPDDMNRPLEIQTSPFRCSGQNESGQESPRIILKINKTFQGSTTEILTEKSQKRDVEVKEENNLLKVTEPLVPKLTIKIPQENSEDRSPSVCSVSNESGEMDANLNSPVARIKLKLLKDGGCTRIVNDECNSSFESVRDGVNRTPRSGVKRANLKDDILDMTKMCTNVDNDMSDAKRLKLDKILSNSSLTITRLTNSRSELENMLASEPKPSITLSLLNLNSDKQCSPISSKRHNTRISTNSLKPKSPSLESNSNELSSFMNRIRNKRNEKSTSVRKNKRNSRFVKEEVNIANVDTNAVSANDIDYEMDEMRPQSPMFSKTGDIIALNEGSSSQECMIVDDLSQDPLDLDSIAKSHFVPVTSNSNIPIVNNNIVNITSPGSSSINTSPSTPKPRRGRGRPRKPRVDPVIVNSPVITTSLDERTLRNSKRPREPVIARTPRGRGRGRGGKRGGAQNSHNHNFTPKPEIVETPNSFFSNSTIFKDVEEINAAVELIESNDVKSPPPPPLEESNIQEESEEASSDSDVSASGDVSPASENLVDGCTPNAGRGRNRGRGVRGSRRTRGGRNVRTPRSTRGGRSTRGTVNRYEEIQLQDAAPTTEVKGSRRSKANAAHNTSLQLFEEDTCMMGDNDASLKDTTILLDDDSHSSGISTAVVDNAKVKKSNIMEINDDGVKEWTAADVAEYDWPPEGCSLDSPPQTYMIQEQVALYLGIKSFKKKYPDLNRKALEPEEKNFLRERGLVSEEMCNLGITAVDAGEVLDIMFTDFPSKYEEYRQHLRETRDTRASNKPPAHLATERSKQETLERARESASSWNARLNRQRRTVRPAVMDLQTLTLHQPRKPQAVAAYCLSSYYPVAVLPGQYTDYYKSYTPEELRYFPFNTVLNVLSSPTRLDEGRDSPSEESADDSDVLDSSSDGSESESSERNFKRKNMSLKAKKATGELTVGSSRPSSPAIGQLPTPSLPPPPVEVPRCKLCSGTEHANRRYPTETFITCATCLKKVHPSCLEMAQNVAKCVRLYAWQCADCKCCARCEDLADDDKMLFCDLCDRGYHIYCVGLKKVPTGRWHCSHCAICRSCGARTPAGLPGAPYAATPGPPEQWHHHLKKATSGQKVYSHTLCGPCARAWRAGRYCSLCERCFIGKKGALKVVICVNCDRTHHKECVRQPGRTLDVLNYMCNGCRRGNTPRRHFVPRKFNQKKPPSNSAAASDSNQNATSNHSQRDVSMDISIDSICTNDSNHQSNSTSCEGMFEDTNKSNVNDRITMTEKIKSSIKNAVKERLLQESNFTNLSNKMEINSDVKMSNNHVENKRDDLALAKTDKNTNISVNIRNAKGKSVDKMMNPSVVCKDVSPMLKETLNISQVSESRVSESVNVQKCFADTAAVNNSVDNCSNEKSKNEISQKNDSINFDSINQKKINDNLLDIKMKFDNYSENT
ncbi:PHD finger protein enhancer of yellow 3 isoform X2 [Arctopsyche grandis]|uniref:PHD finger protein enhancer of yellow 3 isoform X2 n=1 Tax=Arctopsyche grandis TaxID=121162 RepID=UPI00406D9611